MALILPKLSLSKGVILTVSVVPSSSIIISCTPSLRGASGSIPSTSYAKEP